MSLRVAAVALGLVATTASVPASAAPVEIGAAASGRVAPEANPWLDMRV